MKNLTLFLVLATATFLFYCCKNEPAEVPGDDQLGVLHFSFSGSDDAMPHFEKGLKLLHNFEYDDACEAFLKAQELDSSFVMAYWGEAMTYNHPLWRQQDYEKGQQALAKLSGTREDRLGMAQSDLERDFLQSMEIMYGETGTKKDRDSMYSKQLELMYGKYAGNEEVAAFYALSLLGAVKAGRDIAAYEKGAAVVKGILEENPNHPGALHYLIHSYDDPDHAPKALNAAFSYSKVAADATHALHMPSHIFVAVGMWDEVVSSNIASWESSVRRVKEKGIEDNAGSYHALHWLMYGRLQKGQIEEAKKLLVDMNNYAAKMPNRQARSYLIDMKGNFLAETGEWSGEVAGFTAEMDDLNVATQALEHFNSGMKNYEKRDASALAAVISAMEEVRKSAANLVGEDGIPMCASSGANRVAPNQVDIDQALVMEMELRGMLADLNQSVEKAEKWLKAATELEAKVNHSFGPPQIVKPSFELYGGWLLTQDRAADAAEQFEKALERGPKRRLALRGRLEAAKLLEDQAKVKELETIIAEIETADKGMAL